VTFWNATGDEKGLGKRFTQMGTKETHVPQVLAKISFDSGEKG